MSLAAAKRSLRLFDSQEPSKTKKKEKKPLKKADNKSTTISNSETKIQFLLECSSAMDKEMEKNVSQSTDVCDASLLFPNVN